MNGKTLGHYRVGEQLGRGGMGEVYVADDLNLNRKVALKFLPEAFAGDPERMARFEREAKLLASLNHPNIAAIYGLEQAEGKRFLVLELVEGETLAQRISKGALPIDEALGVCRQITDGLEAAHEKGVIHRDLKPANVMITEGDKVKILDFGLAKALSDETQSIDSSQSPTLTEAMTRPGVILGTAAYMSPEQAKGKFVDKRADIWAFGCILYECLTGKRTFEGETVTETLAAVLTRDPDLASVPAKVRMLLQRCLERDPKKRLRDIGDGMAWIENAPEAAAAGSPRRAAFVWAFATLLVGIALGFAASLYFRPTPPKEPVRRFAIMTDRKFTLEPWAPPLVSPDGHYIAIIAINTDGKYMLYVQPLDSLEPRPLAETDHFFTPFWAPDSRQIAFTSQGKLKRVQVTGGPIQTICDTGGIGAWGDDGKILFASGFNGPILSVPASGGVPQPVTAPDKKVNETGHAWPQFLPDNRHFLYIVLSGPNRTVRVSSLDSGESVDLFVTSSQVVYAPPGYLLYVHESTLMAREFDFRSLELRGVPAPVADRVAAISYSGGAGFSLSKTGILAYMTDETMLGQLEWYDRHGKLLGTVGPPGYYTNPAISPDGRRIAVDMSNTPGAQPDIWTFNIARQGDAARFTFNPGDSNASWSPAGDRLAFSSLRESFWDLYVKGFPGADKDELLLKSSEDNYVTSWTADGKLLMITRRTRKPNYDLWILDLQDRKSFPYLNTDFNESFAQFSPDGRWVAYVSDESALSEIYVQTYPRSGIKVKISSKGGNQPKWRGDGKEIYYLSPDGKVMAVSVSTKPEFMPGVPVALFNYRATQLTRNNYDVTNDGQRFLVIRAAEESTAFPSTIILNWTGLLNK